MKTPMQEVYENFNLMSDADFKSWMLNTDLLEKEEEVIISAYIKGQYDTVFCVKGGVPSKKAKQYYNETFKSKER
jgi:hypothetical protein